MYRKVELKEYECYVDDQNGLLYEKIEGEMIPLTTGRIIEMMVEQGDFEDYLRSYEDKMRG